MRKAVLLIGKLLLLTGCFHEMHELRPSEYGDTPVGYLATALSWEQAEDSGTPITDLSFFISGPGASFGKSYKDAIEATGELLQLPVGEYDILVTANMTEADGYILTGVPATKAESSLGDIRVSLKDPASSPAQAWFGFSHASVKEDGIVVAETKLHRLLSTLTVIIANMPEGTRMTLALSNVASDVSLTAKDGNGKHGVPGSVTVGDITIPSSAVNLLPTASGKARCFLTLELNTAAGIPLTVVCDAPRMEVGKAYTLELDYTLLKPYLFVTSCSISPWEDGWTVSGEILDPKE